MTIPRCLGFTETVLSYLAHNPTTSTGTASLKLNRDPLGSQFLNDSADALGFCVLDGGCGPI